MESSGGSAVQSGMQAAGQSHVPFSTSHFMPYNLVCVVPSVTYQVHLDGQVNVVWNQHQAGESSAHRRAQCVAVDFLHQINRPVAP